MTIDSLTKDSSLLNLIKNQGLKCLLKQHSNDYIEVTILIPYSLFAVMLEKAIAEEPENIFIINLDGPSSWDIISQRPFDKLVTTGIASAFISVSLDENALLITLNKSLVNAQELYKKIKALRFG